MTFLNALEAFWGPKLDKESEKNGRKRAFFGLSEAWKWSKIALKWTRLTRNHSQTVPGYLIKLIDYNLAYLSDIDSLLIAF